MFGFFGIDSDYPRGDIYDAASLFLHNTESCYPAARIDTNRQRQFLTPIYILRFSFRLHRHDREIQKLQTELARIVFYRFLTPTNRIFINRLISFIFTNISLNFWGNRSSTLSHKIAGKIGNLMYLPIIFMYINTFLNPTLLNIVVSSVNVYSFK